MADSKAHSNGKNTEMVGVTTVGARRAQTGQTGVAVVHNAPQSDSKQQDSSTPSIYAIGELLQACAEGDMHRLISLIKAGVSPNAHDYDKRYGLHLAACEGQVSAVKFLLEASADPNVVDRFGSTPLDDAVQHGHIHVANLLRKHGAQRSDEGLKKQVFQLVTAADEGNLDKMKLLISNGVDVNSADYDKRTALHLAVASRNLAIVKFLLQAGADPHFKDHTGLTPFEDAKRRKPRVGEDPIYEEFLKSELVLEHGDVQVGNFGYLFLLWELILIILFTTCTTYDPLASGADSFTIVECTDGNIFCAGAGATLRQEYVDSKYPVFQDVHVMIFVGFGFLMTFLAKHSFSSVGFNFLVAAATIQWYIVCAGFFEQVILNGGDSLHKIYLNLNSLVFGDFGAGAVLISFGVLLGKVSATQLLAMSIIEIIFYSINESIGISMGVADPGGSMVIHMFGAFFGLACSYALTPQNEICNKENRSAYHSDMFAMIGTLFLWMFWPSFNAVLTDGAIFHRIVINTVLSLTGSCFVAFCSSYILRQENKFDMVDIQNATLAGGVAIGTSAGLLGTDYAPGMSILVGGVAGFVSVYGYTRIQPYLEKSLGLSDTCGVNNLHGMPSIVGAIAGVIASSQATKNMSNEQIAFLFPNTIPAGGTRPVDDQWKFQLAYMGITLGISIVSGLCVGLLLRTVKTFNPLSYAEQYLDSSSWEVPNLETPYYFDERGEIAHDPKKLEGGRDTGFEERLLDLEARQTANSRNPNGSSSDTPVANPNEAAISGVSTMFQAVMARLEAMDARMQLAASKSKSK